MKISRLGKVQKVARRIDNKLLSQGVDNSDAAIAAAMQLVDMPGDMLVMKDGLKETGFLMRNGKYFLAPSNLGK